MKPTHFTIPLAIYHSTLTVSIGQTDAEFSKIAETYGDTYEDYCDFLNNDRNGVHGLSNQLPSNNCFIRLYIIKKYTKYEYLDIISHEVFHIVAKLAENIGLRLKCGISCEAYAYLQGYLTSEICKKLKL